MDITKLSNVIDLSKSVSQARFAELIGISQPAVSDLVNRGILPRGASAGEWLLAYTARLREQAAGRKGDGDATLDLVAERARLAKEQADAKAMDNAIRRRELAPVSVISATFAEFASRIVPILEGLPIQLRRKCNLDAAALDVVTEEIVKARNEAAGLLDVLMEKVDESLANSGQRAAVEADDVR